MSSKSKFPVLVRGGVEKTPDTLAEFWQLNYDGWAKKNPDAEIPAPEAADDSSDPKQTPATPPPPKN